MLKRLCTLEIIGSQRAQTIQIFIPNAGFKMLTVFQVFYKESEVSIVILIALSCFLEEFEFILYNYLDISLLDNLLNCSMS